MCWVAWHQIFEVRVQAKVWPMTDTGSFAVSLALRPTRDAFNGPHITVYSGKRKKFGDAAERKVCKQMPGNVIQTPTTDPNTVTSEVQWL